MPTATAETTLIVRRPRWDHSLVDAHTLVLTILPDIDWNDSRRVRRFVERYQDVRVVSCDCRHVDITSTAAIGWLITLYRWTLQHGIDFKVVNPPASSLAAYRSQGLDGLLPFAA